MASIEVRPFYVPHPASPATLLVSWLSQVAFRS